MAPQYAKAYHLRGLAHEKAGDCARALQDFDQAVDLDPEYGAAYYSRANLRTKMGQTDLATEDIEMVTHLTELEIERFSNDNNVWRSQQLRLEALDPDLVMER
ncbi:MAG: tetratricopeptide repeat protein [Desulfobacterales bacterium]|nr:MAG: tetratricopeptide repeat protein [Desulfobacterales bacterium]